MAPLGRKGQGKGKHPTGQGKGNPTSLREQKKRATPTTEEIKCPNCPAYNWTMRSVWQSCGHKFPPAVSSGTSIAAFVKKGKAAKTSDICNPSSCGIHLGLTYISGHLASYIAQEKKREHTSA